MVILNKILEEAKRNKQSSVLFKLDFEKAYDSVDWNFLDVMMKKLNFYQKWRAWVNSCASLASSSILVNGSLTEEFKLERGLCQGDSLSPFIFLIVAEGLSLLLSKVVSLGLLEPKEVGKDGQFGNPETREFSETLNQTRRKCVEIKIKTWMWVTTKSLNVSHLSFGN